ncbi:thioredoxin family protein [Parasedimentitalea psychrophila]|uniref:Thioredoxin family protein n=1 Tax=Parasedimentitalea psychrophila TaxID=2997337 RepID=A0A9Y2KYE2_9RHOB|nr:thioredoxin family protein [Parasedimentitalea psychrophila]WIY24729.1 thioredoxin family protein [Parasedimentitalea psychrophila]
MRYFLSGCALLFAMTLGAFAAEVGDDGLHKAPWMRDTFKDLREDLGEANATGKRLMVIIEQRGCIYCKKMHEEVFPVEEIATYIEENFFVVQINMFGDVDVTDFDGVTMPEKQIVNKWGALFTPMILFFPEDVAADASAATAAVATMPGAFGRHTTFNMLNWIVEKGYDGDEGFQKYHARRLSEQSN